MNQQVEFKPFTIDEVKAITKAENSIIDKYVTILGARVGDDRETIGLDYMQTFAVMVADRYLKEGAGEHRATQAAEFIASVPAPSLEQAIQKGDTMICAPLGTFVPRPKTRLGSLLNMARLYGEFRSNLKKVFPKG